MASRGKSINLFLMDGDAGGRIKCTLANWTGVAYKIPRTELDKCKERRKNANVNEQGVLQEDMLFTSPSYAAMFVIDKSVNGLTSWKDERGKTLKSLESLDTE